MFPNYLFSNFKQPNQYLLELIDGYTHHIWLTELKSKEPSNSFLNRLINNQRSNSNYVDSSTIKLHIVSEFTDRIILKRFVMVEKINRHALDNIDPLIRWSFQCGFFRNFIFDTKTFRLTKIGGIDIMLKSWELHLCSLAHSSLWDRNSTFINGNQQTIEGQTISLNPNFILDLD